MKNYSLSEQDIDPYNPHSRYTTSRSEFHRHYASPPVAKAPRQD